MCVKRLSALIFITFLGHANIQADEIEHIVYSQYGSGTDTCFRQDSDIIDFFAYHWIEPSVEVLSGELLSLHKTELQRLQQKATGTRHGKRKEKLESDTFTFLNKKLHKTYKLIFQKKIRELSKKDNEAFSAQYPILQFISSKEADNLRARVTAFSDTYISVLSSGLADLLITSLGEQVAAHLYQQLQSESE